MDREDHDRELTLLRRRLAALTDEARKNDDAWQRAQPREMELLEADTLDALLERLTSGLARELPARRVDTCRRRPRSRDPALVVVARVRRGRARAACSSWTPCTASRRGRRRPAAWLGKFVRADHALLFPASDGARERRTAAAHAAGPVHREPEFRQPRARAIQGGARHGFLESSRRHRGVRARECREPRAPRPQRLYRCAYRLAQPSLPADAVARGARALPPRTYAADVPHDRRRSLQVGQRSVRSLGGRRGAAPARALHWRGGARQRRLGSLWRRGIRRSATRTGHRGGLLLAERIRAAVAARAVRAAGVEDAAAHHGFDRRRRASARIEESISRSPANGCSPWPMSRSTRRRPAVEMPSLGRRIAK